MLTQVTTDYDIVISNGTIDRSPYDQNSTVYNDPMPVDTLLMNKWWPLAFEALFPPVAVNITPAEDYSELRYRKCVVPYERQIRPDGGPVLSSCSNGTTLQTPLLANDQSIVFANTSQSFSDGDTLCNLTWSDPMNDMIDKLQSLAFRITLDMAQADPSIFAPTYNSTGLENLR